MERRRDSFFLSDKKQKKTDKQQAAAKFKEQRNEKFDKNRQEFKNKEKKVNSQSNDADETKSKKPFDKKTYRLKKYSNKYKLEQWEEQRKKKLLRNYYKEVKNDPVVETYKPKAFDQDVPDGEVGRFVKHPDLIDKEKSEENNKKVKKDPFWKAKEQFKKIKDEKIIKQQEIQKQKEEKESKLAEYKKKKQERYKKLSKKTKKGQPVMTGRLELLLEKIQKSK